MGEWVTGITAAHIPIQKAEYRAPRGAGRPSKMRHLGKPVGGGGKFYDIYILEYIIILYHKKSTPPYALNKMHHFFLQNCRSYRRF